MQWQILPFVSPEIAATLLTALGGLAARIVAQRKAAEARNTGQVVELAVEEKLEQDAMHRGGDLKPDEAVRSAIRRTTHEDTHTIALREEDIAAIAKTVERRVNRFRHMAEHTPTDQNLALQVARLEEQVKELQKNQLGKWDVLKVIGTVLGGLGALTTLLLALSDYLEKKAAPRTATQQQSNTVAK